MDNSTYYQKNRDIVLKRAKTIIIMILRLSEQI